MPEDVEESALVKKLVAPSAPTAADQEEHMVVVVVVDVVFVVVVNVETRCLLLWPRRPP